MTIVGIPLYSTRLIVARVGNRWEVWYDVVGWCGGIGDGWNAACWERALRIMLCGPWAAEDPAGTKPQKLMGWSLR